MKQLWSTDFHRLRVCVHPWFVCFCKCVRVSFISPHGLVWPPLYSAWWWWQRLFPSSRSPPGAARSWKEDHMNILNKTGSDLNENRSTARPLIWTGFRILQWSNTLHFILLCWNVKKNVIWNANSGLFSHNKYFNKLKYPYQSVMWKWTLYWICFCFKRLYYILLEKL